VNDGFAVVLTTRDRPALLADALRSVNAQTLAPLEVVIANDSAQPLELAVSSLGKLPVHVLQVEVRNPGAARNRAVAGTSAPWLAFLDDDDLWLPDHLAGLATVFANPSTELAYRDCAVIREEILESGRRIERARRVIARDWDDGVMRENDFIPPSATAVRRSAFERLGGFDASFACSEDWDFLLRAARGTKPARAPGVTVEIRLRPSGNASAETGSHRRESLDRLSALHGLPHLEIKTFWEVAGDLERTGGVGRP
jgi:glycosyltransferase involved in cell wall biosynthesis